jgi:hypothetical protein
VAGRHLLGVGGTDGATGIEVGAAIALNNVTNRITATSPT